MKRILLLPLVFVAFLRPLLAEDYEVRTFTAADGRTLPYRLLKPQDYDAAKKYPLVLLLHGSGERGTDNEAQLKHGGSLFTKPEVRAKYPAFVLVPQCPPNQTWSMVKGWNSDV